MTHRWIYLYKFTPNVYKLTSKLRFDGCVTDDIWYGGLWHCIEANEELTKEGNWGIVVWNKKFKLKKVQINPFFKIIFDIFINDNDLLKIFETDLLRRYVIYLPLNGNLMVVSKMTFDIAD